MNGEFIQFDPNGEQRQGKFFIARPGRVRFQYDPPMAISVVADGKSVMIHDKKLQTYDCTPLPDPVAPAAGPNLDLSTSDRVTNISVAPDLIEVELQDETRFSAGTLNLVFDRASSELRQWTVTDQQGLQTLVTLYNVELGQRPGGRSVQDRLRGRDQRLARRGAQRPLGLKRLPALPILHGSGEAAPPNTPPVSLGQPAPVRVTTAEAPGLATGRALFRVGNSAAFAAPGDSICH
jgi:hypothetical protein